MNKKLPNVYAVPITKKFSNNKESFRSTKEDVRGEKISKSEINKIFNSKSHVYKTRVIIKTNNEIKEVDVVGQTNDALLTLDGQTILLDNILEIKKV